MKDARPLLFGEILFDHLPDGDSALGGAPLNVAVHLAGLGERPLLVSRVGADREGELARATLERFGVDLRGVQIDPARETGAVRVEIPGGEPRFEILAPRAWDAIDADRALATLDGVEPRLLYHGVLAARESASRRALRALRSRLGGRVFLDVNLRPPWTPPARALELARGAAWLKLSEGELATLAGAPDAADPLELEPAARSLLERAGAQRLVVTRGSRGALLLRPDRAPLAVAARPVEEAKGADPVGAGDAFAAVLILAELREWPALAALDRASELAAAVCGLHGALPAAPGWYEPFRRSWMAR